MKFHVLSVTAREAVIELEEDAVFKTSPYEIEVNGSVVRTSDRMVTSIYGLQPDSDVLIRVRRGDDEASCMVHTAAETGEVNPKDFGAFGDGEHEDTQALQAAILCCPEGGRVVVEAGTYPVTALFLKSNITVELKKDAWIVGIYDRERIPVLPAQIRMNTAGSEKHLGTWEGVPAPAFASLFTGIGVSGVTICGEGGIDGRAGFENWWKDAKVMNRAWRPRMIFFNHCSDMLVAGIQVQNSPAWNIHPYFSQNLRFYDLSVTGPWNSHNTDGCDPESCSNVQIVGVHFSVGDDCIAVKSGKIEMGRTYRQPSEHIEVRQCYMHDGHGAFTVGSEIGAGVDDIHIDRCLFENTDRGLRIKTRRGRGKDSVLKGIVCENLKMDGVKAPFVVNSFYYCDADGKSDYVQCRTPLQVDERTPRVDSLTFRNIDCRNTHFCAAHVSGLPEQKIRRLELENVRVSYAQDAQAGLAAMACYVDETKKAGLIISNVETLVLKNVELNGCEGNEVSAENVDEIIR